MGLGFRNGRCLSPNLFLFSCLVVNVCHLFLILYVCSNFVCVCICLRLSLRVHVSSGFFINQLLIYTWRERLTDIDV